MVHEVKKRVGPNLLPHVLFPRDLHVRIEVCLLLLLAALLLLQQLGLEAHAERLRDVFLNHVALDALPVVNADVDKHVRIGVLWHLEAQVIVEALRGVLVLAKLIVHCALGVLLCHALVLEAVPLVAVWADESVVVAAVHAAAVHQHAVQAVQVAHFAIRLGAEVLAVPHVQIQLIWKLVAVVDLDHHITGKVVLEALQLELQHGREILEQHPLARILHAMTVCLVLVLTVQHLHRAVLVKAVIHVLAAFHVQLQVHEALCPRRLVIYVDTLNVVPRVPLKQLLNDALHARALHLLLQLLAQHAVELLHIMLHEGVVGVPAKRLGEHLGRSRGRLELHFVKEVLKRERDVSLRLLVRGGHVVHALPEVVDVVERLQQGVHVARRALVLQAHKARLRARVVEVQVGLAHVDLHADHDAVVH
mmetsp:Transcript_1048/g.2442  ORF Transcript_1048/g.2442 Transcript_1048/m.2442 type:complete len:420 (-) Transcript_1048:691-1950(-)